MLFFEMEVLFDQRVVFGESRENLGDSEWIFG